MLNQKLVQLLAQMVGWFVVGFYNREVLRGYPFIHKGFHVLAVRTHWVFGSQNVR